jgi:acyl transferase domain-containing protein/NADPH:quinone reductase-like Zn-dependent oxidoreductase/acyl carrier protein
MPADDLSLKQQTVLLLRQMQARYDAMVQARNAPVAVVGLGCRFPGGAGNPEAFWELLSKGVDAVSEVPPERWAVDAYYDPEPDAPGKINSRWGAFLPGIDQFDAGFFGISPREAANMDPQQRLALEVAWEALEHAGQAPDRLEGSRTGVFMGICSSDYNRIERDLDTGYSTYSGTGTAMSVVAGRLSYILGLQGPSLVVDTACSSSLVSVHLAVQSLRTDECDMALAGGVNVILISSGSQALARLHMLAPDGRCKAFDAAADGFVRGEGCGVLVLKRLADARAHGDNIIAVIRGSAVNQDGRSSGLTAPNGAAQVTVIREALKNGGVDPGLVSYIEAHGTGTALGDPIEVHALAQVFAAGRNPQQPLSIGSVKTNLGHLESAAGIVGLIKTVLALSHREMPPHLHFKALNPHIQLDGFPAVIPTLGQPWEPISGRRVAGVSSFGFSGTNAHVVVEEAPPPEPQSPAERQPSAHLLCLSAKDELALRELAARYETYLTRTEVPLAAICATANSGRAHFQQRVAVIAPEVTAARQRLAAYRAGQQMSGVVAGACGTRAPRVAFLFTGQGAQYAAMGYGLYQTEPRFRAVLDRCDAVLRDCLERPLLSVMFEDHDWLDETMYAQPALFALEVALAELWRVWGIEPYAVLGHSVGEYAAACVAGVFSLEEGLRLIAARGRLMQALTTRGAMAQVRAAPEQVRQAVAATGAGLVSIAAENGPAATVISGDEAAVDWVLAQLHSEGISCRPLRVSHAFHSALLDPMLGAFEQVAENVAYAEARMDVISNLTGHPRRSFDAMYWRRQARQTVRFADGVRSLAEQGCAVYVEIGPQPVLSGLGPQCVTGGTWVASLRRGAPEWSTLLEALGRLYVSGVKVDWAGFDRGSTHRKVALPTYPFQRQRFWLEAPQPVPSHHALLGQRLEVAIQDIVFEASLGVDTPEFLAEHRVHGLAVFPAAGFLVMALAAATQGLEAEVGLEHVAFQEPLVLPPSGTCTVQVVVTPGASPAFKICSGSHRDWTVHVTGALRLAEPVVSTPEPLEAVQTRCTEALPVEAFYDWLRHLGIDYGPRFATIQALWRGQHQALARLHLPDQAGAYPLHPILIDACFQTLGATAYGAAEGALQIPVGLDTFQLYRQPTDGSLWSYAVFREAEPQSVGDIIVYDADGRLVAEARGLHLKAVSRQALLGHSATAWRDWLYEPVWREKPLPMLPELSPMAPHPESWMIFADSQGVGDVLAAHLRATGHRCVLIRPGAVLAHPAEDTYQIDPAATDDFQRLFAEQPCHGIVHLWSIDTAPPEETTPERLMADQIRSCASVLHSVQALQDTTPRLVLAMRGARGEVPAQAPLWGLGRVIALERPELHCLRLDCDPDASPQETARALLAELGAGDGEDQVAYRQGRREVPRLVRAAEAPVKPLTLRADASYLITGGFGGLGLRVAHWLVEHGARHLVLCGRRGLPAEAHTAVAALEGLGATVLCAQADISSQDGVQRLLERITASLPPLRGVIHAAGVLDDGVLERQNWTRFARVMAPKMAGAWALHRLTHDLDFFALFSSAVCLMGSVGQGNYVAANAFLDALAQHRRALGLPGLSLNWGAWSEVGAAAERDFGPQLTGQGMQVIPPEQGLAVLAWALAQPAPQFGVLPIAWPVFMRQFDEAHPVPPVLAELVPQASLTASPGAGRAAEVEILAALQGAPAAERRALLCDFVRDRAASVLGFASAQALSLHTSLFDLGLDSLMAVELRNRLQTSLGNAVTLAATLIFDHPTVEALTGYLATRLLEKPQDEGHRLRTRDASAPIAIIGMGCRFPGGAHDPESFWRLLRAGVNTITEVPKDRWDMEAYCDSPTTRWGAFLDHVDRFDPQFFGIAPREAVSMDPQHRLLLEVAWEALEHAGRPPDALVGSRTGVFVGMCNYEYAQIATADGHIDAYAGTGSAPSVAAGRLSYILGLNGPSLVVDTACSSSLVTVHLAVQGLRNGECDMALAGGVNLILTPATTIAMSALQVIAPDGRCKTFDATADGIVRGEGCGLVVLKRLPDALADGDRILAVIRGSAVNQDGRSSGLTAPSGPAQETVIHEALHNAGLDASLVSYIEAHGTGTALGDPIEVHALSQVFAPGRSQGHPLVIGSVKTNVGHLEAAAGVVGLIKTTLALRHREIPPHLHFTTLNPHIALDGFPAVIPTAPLAWQPIQGQRVAGVSSFSINGTNAHVVLEEAPTLAPLTEEQAWPAQLLCLSAKSTDALQELAGRYQAHLEHCSDALAHVCFTANAGRAHFAQRLAVVGATANEFREKLAVCATGTASLVEVTDSVSPPRIVFLFTGQGSQYVGMGRALYQMHPRFRAVLERCDAVLRDHLDRSLLSVLFDGDGYLNDTVYTQPALFALEVALAELWQSWGLEPSAVLGHSVGEYAAACIAGVFDIETGLRLVAERGRLMQALPAGGAMAAVLTSAERVAAAIADYPDLALAACNSPANTVIAGAEPALRQVMARLADEGIRAQPLTVSHAFHSPLMEPMLDAFERIAGQVAFAEARLPVFANLTGQATRSFTAAYWRQQARQPVQFAQGLRHLAEQGAEIFVEIGPHPVLSTLGQACIADRVWLPSLRRGGEDWRTLLESLGRLYQLGAQVDWAGFYQDQPRVKVAVPTYPFQRQRYWAERVPAPVPRAAGKAVSPLLGSRLRSALRQYQFERLLAEGDPAYLSDHRVGDQAVFPAAGFIEMALVAAAEALGSGSLMLEDLVLRQSLPLDQPRTVQVILTPGEMGVIEILSTAEDMQEWTLHVTGSLRKGATAPQSVSLQSWRARCTQAVSPAAYYEAFASRALHYGPAFQAIVELWQNAGEALARVVLPDGLAADGYLMHPVLLDACFQNLGAALPTVDEDEYLPMAVDRLLFFARPGRELWSAARLRPGESETMTSDIVLFDAQDRVFAEVQGLRLQRMRRQTAQRLALVHDIAWEEAPPVAGRLSGDWTVLAADGGFGATVAMAIQAHGAACRLVPSLPADVGTDVLYLRGLDATAAETVCDELLALVKTLLALKTPPRLWVVTQGARAVAAQSVPPTLAQTPLWGLGAVIALEHPELRCRRIDLDAGAEGAHDLIQALVAAEAEVALRHGVRYLPRLVGRGRSRGERDVPEASFALEIAQRGTLDGVQFAPLTRRRPGPGEVEVRVRATGLNFRDVMNVLGVYPGDTGPPGGECAGVVTELGEGVHGLTIGQEVIAVASGCFASHVVAAADLVVPKPERLSFAEAASIPVAFLTAWHSLRHIARLMPGQRILIHAAAGGVGMAAVRIASQIGAEIFATAGSPEKRAFLTALDIPHVMDSRSLTFATEVLQRTAGRGVDVVLNSLTGDFIPQSLSVLAPGGCFVELGKAEVWAAERVRALRSDVAYHPITLDTQIFTHPALVSGLLREVLSEIDAGKLQLLPTCVFPIEQIEAALRYMQQARHIGKIVLAQCGLRADAAYLISGGLGGLGLRVAAWMVEQGARYLTLIGRSAPSESAAAAVQRLREAGARIQVVQADVANEDDVQRVLSGLERPLKGIVHAAGVLDDGLLLLQNEERFARVMASKATGAWNLHKLTQGLQLDMFVLFASAAGLLGSVGQGNYAAANTFLDGLAWYRRAMGLPALSIDWGAWGEVGMAAQRSHVGPTIAPDDALCLLSRLLRDGSTQVCVLPQPLQHADRLPTGQRFDGFHDVLMAAPASERAALLAAKVRELAATVLALAPHTIPARQALHELGLDSLMAVELRNALSRALRQTLPATLLFDYPNVEVLTGFLAQELGYGVEAQEDRADLEAGLWDAVNTLSDQEVEAELMKELDREGY